MYVTRPMSRFLTVEDKVAVERATVCWGLCHDTQLHSLPFPQSRNLELDEDDSVVFVPFVGEPLSAHRYYVVQATGREAGKVSACSREQDKTTFRFFSFVNDVPPRPFHHCDVYQQVEVVKLPHRGFKAVAVAPDGIPSGFLRRKGWQVSKLMYTNYGLTGDAQGIDWPLRLRMPNLDGISIGTGGSPAVVVGRWYCPFMFIRDGKRLKDQVKWSMFYKMTLEQSWEEIYICDNEHVNNRPDEVNVSVTVRRSTALLGLTGAVQEGGPQVVDGVMWFRPAASAAAVGEVGLDMVVWEQMRLEMERGGCVIGNGDVERIERVERHKGLGQWHKFSFYLLLERFVLRRMDTSVALSYGFRYTNSFRTKWV